MKLLNLHSLFKRIAIICLIIFQCNCNKENEKIAILKAEFTTNQTAANFTQTINFIDLSENNPTNWLWDFGDDETSTLQNPSHNYSKPGTYTVTLNVTNNYGSDTKNKTDYITVKSIETGTVSDYDGNVYNTVKIGDQWWMSENLRTTHYADGIALVDGTNAGNIIGDDPNMIPSSRYYFSYDNDDSQMNVYGRLYTWTAALNGSHDKEAQGVCPNGWHIPTDSEWDELIHFLGGDSLAGGKLKETGTVEEGDGLWYSPNMGATNETGFTGLPGGYRVNNGSFYYYLGYISYYWSSSVTFYYGYNEIKYINTAYGLIYGSSKINYKSSQENPIYASNGYCVRCIKN